MSETKHTPGATRAGKNISDRFRGALPNLPQSNAETLAAIIDAETGAPELLEACQEAVEEYRLAKVAGFDPLMCLEKTAKLAHAAIAKAERGA